MLPAFAYDGETVSVIKADKNGLLEINTKVAVDATGDANVASMMGYPCEKSTVQQPATLQNRISGYDINDIDMQEIEKALEKADFTLAQQMTAKRLFSFLKMYKIDIHTLCNDADTSVGKTQVECEAVSNLMQVCVF